MCAKHTSLLEKAQTGLGSCNVYDLFDFFQLEAGFYLIGDAVSTNTQLP